MHELSIAQSIVEHVVEQAGEARVRRVVLEVGALSAVLPDALRFCFDLACEGTSAEGATLEIIVKPGLGRCRACSAEVALLRPFGRCGCGATDLEWLAGEELRLREMEVC